jgi:hypothetical protein
MAVDGTPIEARFMRAPDEYIRLSGFTHEGEPASMTSAQDIRPSA